MNTSSVIWTKVSKLGWDIRKDIFKRRRRFEKSWAIARFQSNCAILFLVLLHIHRWVKLNSGKIFERKFVVYCYQMPSFTHTRPIDAIPGWEKQLQPTVSLNWQEWRVISKLVNPNRLGRPSMTCFPSCLTCCNWSPPSCSPWPPWPSPPGRSLGDCSASALRDTWTAQSVGFPWSLVPSSSLDMFLIVLPESVFYKTKNKTKIWQRCWIYTV